ncbi:MAG: hypothetical protein ACP5HC_07565, partial [Caldisericum sp.]
SDPLTGRWLTWTAGDQSGTYIDETGYFRVYSSPPTTSYIRITTNLKGQVFSPTDTITVSWEVAGFTGTEGNIRVLFFNGQSWSILPPKIDLANGSYTINLSNLKDKDGNSIKIKDPFRCRIRVGVYDPSTGVPSDPLTGRWLTWTAGDQSGTYIDETGQFWVIPH